MVTEYTEDMHQAATYWPPGGNDGFGGTGYGSPEALQVRWQETSQLFRDAQGNEVTSEAVVYPPKPLLEGGQLLLGTSAAAEPAPDAREIRKVNSTVDLDADQRLTKVML